MSRAFVNEDENDLAKLPDWPISPRRNFVTEAGLRRLRPLSAVSRRRIAPQQTKATGKPLSLLCWKSVTGERGARGNWRSLSRSRRRSSQHEAEYSNRPP